MVPNPRPPKRVHEEILSHRTIGVATLREPFDLMDNDSWYVARLGIPYSDVLYIHINYCMYPTLDPDQQLRQTQ